MYTINRRRYQSHRGEIYPRARRCHTHQNSHSISIDRAAIRSAWFGAATRSAPSPQHRRPVRNANIPHHEEHRNENHCEQRPGHHRSQAVLSTVQRNGLLHSIAEGQFSNAEVHFHRSREDQRSRRAAKVVRHLASQTTDHAEERRHAHRTTTLATEAQDRSVQIR